MIILNNIPFIFLSFITTQIFYISFISIFSWIDFYKYFYLLQFILFFASFLFLKRYKNLFNVEKIKLKNWFYLLIPYLIIIFIRFPMYTKVHDDLTYYLVAGEYTKNLWTNPHFLPTYAIYFYNTLPLYYNILVSNIGLRLTLLVTNLVLAFWMVSLNLRYKKLLKTNLQKYLLDFFFISFPFWPHLMAIHGTFMADYIALVFVIEAFYQFINKEKNKTFALILFIISGLVKQSSVFYVIPIFIYLFLKNFKNINWKIFILVFLFFSSYFIKLYFEVGNPILGGLYNQYFNSPIVGESSGPGLKAIFGGQTLVEKIIWPIIGQFSGRFGEGFVSKYAKWYFSIFLIFGYFFILYIFFKDKILSISILTSFLIWSFDLGYSRWIAPTIALSWLSFIYLFQIKKIIIVKNDKLKEKYLYFIYFLIIILSMSSIKTDFGWRPYHNLSYLKNLYFEGFKYIGKDRYKDFLEIYKKDFKDIDVISIIRSEKAYFYGFLGSFNGSKLIQSANDKYFSNILKSDKISNHLKNNLKNIINSKKVMIVVDTMSVPEGYINGDYFYLKKDYKCKKINNPVDSRIIQNLFMDSIVRYICAKDI